MIVVSWNWSEYYHIARFLCSDCQGDKTGFSKDAEIRCGISRAYYAAFHVAMDYAMKNTIENTRFNPKPEEAKSADIHKLVIQYYHDKHKDAIAQKLGMLRDWRNDCDYHPEYNHFYEGALSRSVYILRECGEEIID